MKVRFCSGPWMTAAPASPARPPAISITSTQLRSTFIPAVRAALGLAPTVRNRNPTVDRDSSHHTPPAAARATRRPASTCGGGPPTCGSAASDAMFGLISFACPGSWRAMLVLSRNASRLYMM